MSPLKLVHIQLNWTWWIEEKYAKDCESVNFHAVKLTND